MLLHEHQRYNEVNKYLLLFNHSNMQCVFTKTHTKEAESVTDTLKSGVFRLSFWRMTY